MKRWPIERCPKCKRMRWPSNHPHAPRIVDGVRRDCEGDEIPQQPPPQHQPEGEAR